MRSPAYLCLVFIVLAGIVGCSAARSTRRIESATVTNRAESPDPAPITRHTERSGGTTGEDSKPAVLSLAEKMAAYSAELEPKLKERDGRKKPANPAPTQVAGAAPSDVQWTGEPAAPRSADADASAGQTAGTPLNSNQVALVTPAPVKTHVTNVPQIVPEGEDVPGQMGPKEAALIDSDQLLRQLAAKVQENPKDLGSQLDYQLLQLVRGERVPHMASIATLPAEDREVLTAMLDGLSNFRESVRGEGDPLLNKKIRPLVEMADRLRSQADLALPTAALCTRVDGFGVYEPIASARFAGAKEHPVIIYCEVQNFASQLNEKKLWETKLSHEAVLYTETGLPVWTDKSSSIIDLSRNRRHDFFIVKKTKLPASLTIGRYVLKLSVTDQQSNRVAETTVPVQIVAQ